MFIDHHLVDLSHEVRRFEKGTIKSSVRSLPFVEQES
jgi:hypothetical protein